MTKKITMLMAALLFGLTGLMQAQWITNDVNWLGTSDITDATNLLDNNLNSNGYLSMSWYSTVYTKYALITFPEEKTLSKFKFKYSFPATVQSPCHGYPGPIVHTTKGKLYYKEGGTWHEAYPVTENLNTTAAPSVCEVVDSVEFIFPDTISAQEWKFEMIGQYWLGGGFQTTTQFKVFELGFYEEQTTLNVFSEITTNFTGVNGGDVEWGDYDNDGDLDVLVGGYTDASYPGREIGSVKIYSNDGNDIFTDINASFTVSGNICGNVAWSDIDNDGDLDVALVYRDGAPNSNHHTKIFKNEGSDIFNDIGVTLIGGFNATLDWADYDQDGDPDLFIQGDASYANYFAKVYLNNGDYTFTDLNAGMQGAMCHNSAGWGDYDNDSFPDLFYGGFSFGITYAKLYNNNGNNTFADITSGIPPTGHSCWIDFDDDNYIDILSCSTNGDSLKIYKNNGGAAFSPTSFTFRGSTQGGSGSVISTDYNNDGYNDIFHTGTNNSYSDLYQNNDGLSFSMVSNSGIDSLFSSDAAFGDYNNDGYPDLIIEGWDGTQNVVKIYKNRGGSTQNNDLVAYYPFNGNANDESGNGHDGTVSGATLTADRFGYANSAYDFDGNQDWITVDNMSGDHEFITASFWFNNPPATVYYPNYFWWENIGWCIEGSWNPYTSGDIVMHPANHGLQNLPLPSFNEWHHVVLTWDYVDSTGTIYLDSSLDTTLFSTQWGFNGINAGLLTIGIGGGYASNTQFTGQLDDICLYNRELSQQEIDSLYHVGGWGDVIANFTASDTTGTAPLTVNFTDLSLGCPTSWQWDFGDGSIDTVQNPTHIYQTAGNYTVSLIVADSSSSDTLVKMGYIFVSSDSSHFVPIWSGNPHNPMMAIVSAAFIQQNNLQPGDEIGIFDADRCVGSTALSQVIDSLDNSSFANIFCSADDANQSGYDGFVPGNEVEYRLWDSSEQEEYTVVDAFYPHDPQFKYEQFTENETSIVQLNGLRTSTLFEIADAAACQGDTLRLEIHTEGMHDVDSLALSITYDASKLQYVSCSNVNSTITSNSVAANSGQIDFIGTGADMEVPLGSLFTLNFVSQPGQSGSTNPEIQGSVWCYRGPTVFAWPTSYENGNALIRPLPQITQVNIVPVSGCHGDANGEISITATANTTDIYYSINAGDTWALNQSDFTNLIAGDYTVTVKDTFSCQSDYTNNPVTITEPTAVSITDVSITEPLCNGSAEGSINITASGGTGSLQYSIDNGSNWQNSNQFAGLIAGDYTITVKDANDCQINYNSNPVTITEPTAVTINDVSINEPLCNGSNEGSITITASGGTGTLQYSIDNGSNWQSGNQFASLTTGDYNITVKDANACQTNYANNPVTITEPTAIEILEVSFNKETFRGASDASITISANGGTAPLQYSIDGGINWQSNDGLFTALDSGEYTVSVRDANQCELIYVNNPVIIPGVHFERIWSGNPLYPMYFSITHAMAEDMDLDCLDEIAIYDGNYCVGTAVLTQSIDSLNNASYVAINCSQDDSGTPATEGYTQGNSIHYRLWDESAQEEYVYVYPQYPYAPNFAYKVFVMGESDVVQLSGQTEIEQEFSLTSGWNIISWNVVPLNMNMESLLEPIIDNGTLKKTIDEQGSIIQELPWGWINMIGDMAHTEGYQVKVSEETDFSTIGYAVHLPMEIPLIPSWNIMSWPLQTAGDAESAVQLLIDEGSLDKVIDENGNILQQLPWGWVNTIGNFAPGKGYQVKVFNECQLTLDEDAGDFKSYIAEQPKAQYIKTLQKGNPFNPMAFALRNNDNLPQNTEIGVYYKDQCFGAAVLTGDYIYITAGTDEADTDVKEGFGAGDAFHFKYITEGMQEAKELEMSYIEGDKTFIERGTFVGEIKSTTATETIPNTSGWFGEARPNPTRDEVFVDVFLHEASNLHFILMDSRGKIVMERSIEKPSGMHEQSIDLSKLLPGMYFLKMQMENQSGYLEKVVRIVRI